MDTNENDMTNDENDNEIMLHYCVTQFSKLWVDLLEQLAETFDDHVETQTILDEYRNTIFGHLDAERKFVDEWHQLWNPYYKILLQNPIAQFDTIIYTIEYAAATAASASTTTTTTTTASRMIGLLGLFDKYDELSADPESSKNIVCYILHMNGFAILEKAIPSDLLKVAKEQGTALANALKDSSLFGDIFSSILSPSSSNNSEYEKAMSDAYESLLTTSTSGSSMQQQQPSSASASAAAAASASASVLAADSNVSSSSSSSSSSSPDCDEKNKRNPAAQQSSTSKTADEIPKQTSMANVISGVANAISNSSNSADKQKATDILKNAYANMPKESLNLFLKNIPMVSIAISCLTGAGIEGGNMLIGFLQSTTDQVNSEPIKNLIQMAIPVIQNINPATFEMFSQMAESGQLETAFENMNFDSDFFAQAMKMFTSAGGEGGNGTAANFMNMFFQQQ
jgi:hypothetical protein